MRKREVEGGREGGGRGERGRGKERILKCLEFSSIVVKGEDQNLAQVTVWQPHMFRRTLSTFSRNNLISSNND